MQNCLIPFSKNLPWKHCKPSAKSELISGKVYEIEKSNWSNEGDNFKLRKLSVWDSPIMI